MGKRFPSYKDLRSASVTSSKSKRENKSRNTEHELILRKELFRLGLRYRLHVQNIIGKPDIVFPRAKVVIFCDGDFWHGRNWGILFAKLKVGSNSEYWTAKIKANIGRDLEVTKILEQEGWLVLRFWENDIKKDPQNIARNIYYIVNGRK